MTARERGRGRILRFAEFRRTVADIDRSIAFYVGALDFERDGDPGTGRARLRLGSETIELVAANAAGRADRGEPLDVAALPISTSLSSPATWLRPPRVSPAGRPRPSPATGPSACQPGPAA